MGVRHPEVIISVLRVHSKKKLKGKMGPSGWLLPVLS
jgi:hypothetical protein